MTSAANQPVTLTELAAQRRAVSAALEVRCPDRRHWHARIGVTCTPPDAQHPYGWVCLARIEQEVNTREARRLHAEDRQRRAIAVSVAAKHRERRARERARVAAAIHEAAQR